MRVRLPAVCCLSCAASAQLLLRALATRRRIREFFIAAIVVNSAGLLLDFRIASVSASGTLVDDRARRNLPRTLLFPSVRSLRCVGAQALCPAARRLPLAEVTSLGV
jgi:hypothetical protein